MKTLIVIFSIWSIIGWINRKIKSSKPKPEYEFNIFNEEPNFWSVTLLITTVASIAGILTLVIMYLP